eukprot:360737-Chlamydomonas_euryale.AAC.2
MILIRVKLAYAVKPVQCSKKCLAALHIMHIQELSLNLKGKPLAHRCIMPDHCCCPMNTPVCISII